MDAKQVESVNHKNLMVNENNNIVVNGKSHFSENSLFDSSIFSKVKNDDLLFKHETLKLIKINNNLEYAFDLGDNLILRSMQRDDFDREYLKLLEQLTIVGDDVTKEKFEERFSQMRACAQTYYVVVIEDLTIEKIVASATLVIEQKFIRHASVRGRVEDVVVNDGYRGKRLGKLLLDLLTQMSKIAGCYKVSLECKDPLKKFYEQFGYQTEESQNYLCKRNQN